MSNEITGYMSIVNLSTELHSFLESVRIRHYSVTDLTTCKSEFWFCI